MNGDSVRTLAGQFLVEQTKDSGHRFIATDVQVPFNTLLSLAYEVAITVEDLDDPTEDEPILRPTVDGISCGEIASSVRGDSTFSR
jgi:hypothetical protein